MTVSRFPVPDWLPSGLLGGLGLLALLLVHWPPEAEALPPSPGDSLTASSVAFTLRYEAPSASKASPPDRWMAWDKAKHLVGSALWTLSTQYVLVNKADWTEGDALPVSIASGAAIGMAKEWYDASHTAEDASARDLAADAMGIGLAVGVILL